ncbi:uncharacterized protein BX663DRAFT_493834 [Cokeromyces recurvatus]|uniref:uncharacterized protein n=1 Tax=Cokeromyces recurvatus TaxID=90255 RepID=UPI00221FB622|nr:uncharacterized protein BX663DRAFT_493834 [Cokeromyces recurvatus]KAI7908330.1 hypothetical protein BX663DRAFT_493834 [Cokeromyces recurvatus]
MNHDSILFYLLLFTGFLFPTKYSLVEALDLVSSLFCYYFYLFPFYFILQKKKYI